MKKILNWTAFNEASEYEVFTNKSGEAFWGDTGAGVLIIAEDTKRLMIGLRSKHVNEPNTWNIFGGQLDEDYGETDVIKGAERELKEETNYHGAIKMIPAFVFTSKDGGFKYHNFIGVIPKEYKPKLDWENSAYKWVTLDELINIEPMHFGLKGLLDNSMDIIKKYTDA